MDKTPKIGAFVLETLTTGMYTNPLDTLREFVQNAADSIRKGEEEGLITKGEGRIQIILDPKARTLVVRDNGIGVHQADAAKCLINIGMSDKRIETDAGFRGIGRLAGIAYCDTLKFKTSALGETTTSIVEMDCNGMKRAISPSLRQVEELSDVMAKYSREEQERTEKDDHFFEVVMEGITEAASDFLDWQVLEKYLCQVAPVKYDAQHFVFSPVISKWIEEHGLSIPTVNLVIKAPSGIERQVFKPYKSHYKTRVGNYKIEIKDVNFFPEEISPDMPFWLWYSETDLLGMIDDERSAGIRFRKNNIALGGPERVAELFPGGEGRLNSWVIGEIHVRSDSMIPNARRDGFEQNESLESLKQRLSPFIAKHCRACHEASSARRPTVKVIAAAQSVIEDADERLESGFVSTEEYNTILSRVIKEEERVSKALESRKYPQDSHKIAPLLGKLKNLRESLQQEKHFAVKKLRSNLDRKQKKVLQEVLQIIHETLSADSCSRSDLCYKTLRKTILTKFQIKESESDS